MCGLENEGSAEIVHGCDAYLSVWIKDEFDPQDGCDGFSEFGTFGSKYLFRKKVYQVRWLYGLV